MTIRVNTTKDLGQNRGINFSLVEFLLGATLTMYLLHWGVDVGTLWNVLFYGWVFVGVMMVLVVALAMLVLAVTKAYKEHTELMAFKAAKNDSNR